MNRNYFVENSNESQRIIITQDDGYTVEAPLPDGFGFTAGSEFSTPFDTGSMNATLSKVLVLSNISQKAGIRMKKMFANPVPTEISFDMEFNSYYDAKNEVIRPAMYLMNMAVGRNEEWDGLKDDMESLLATIGGAITTGAEYAGVDFLKNTKAEAKIKTTTDQDKVLSKGMDLIGIIRGPNAVTIKFGKTLNLEDCFITSVGVKFSNVLDIYGLPTSCVCSVTATPQQSPIMDDINGYFGNI